MNYVNLHTHTDYSLLDGLNTSEEYMFRVKELGMTHLAQTDHGSLAGHRDFQRAAQKHGITPILGCEMYISPTTLDDRRSAGKRTDGTNIYNHLIVLAQDAKGLQNLNRLSEIAWTQGFYSKPRIDLDVLEQHSGGLVVLSGCLSGLVAKAIANDDLEGAYKYAERFKSIFDDRFYMEVQGHNPENINKGLVHVASKFDIKLVATSDCHYAREEDLWLEEAMLILSTNPKQAKDFDFSKSQKMSMLERFNYAYPDRSMTFEQYGIFLHSVEQELTLMRKCGIPDEAVYNTQEIADSIGEYDYYEGLDLLPRPEGVDADEMLREMVVAGAKRRGTYGKEVYDARRELNLKIIKDKGFAPYFIIEADAMQWGRNQGMLFGPGRGSGAGFLVNYELGITEVDPVEFNLLDFRFINPERNDWPDIDTDVEVHRRSDLKDYVLRKYEHVASISTFGTFAGKESVRSAARVFLVPLGDVNRALKGADWPNDWFGNWERTEKGMLFKKNYPEVIKLAKFLHGRKRTQGMHAGGLVVSSKPITDYAPIQTAKDNSDASGARIPVVALDMDSAAEVGLIKYDFLGLKALSIIAETISTIKSRTGKNIDLNALPLDDQRVYKNLSDGYTRGIFQCEATPYTNLIIKMGGLKGFNDLVASNALVRPGAMNSSAGAAYIARNKGEQMVDYHHPDMVDFTRDTYGVVIYQEQVMLTMTELAGMPMATADKVRKIIGKKRDVAEFEQYKAMFVEGASKKITKKQAESLWHDFEAHAGYSFNKSHAVAYSMLSYWTAWLKEYYPLEFMTAVLSNEGDKDSLLDYLMETKRMGVRIMLPHVNSSAEKFEIQSDEQGDYIRFGLSNVKYIAAKAAYAIINQRPFDSYAHLLEVSMTKGSGISTRVVGALNAVGGAAFHDHVRTGNERDNFFEYLNIPAFNTADLSPRMKAQFRPLDEFSDTETFVSMGMVRAIKTGPGWARVEVVDESGSAGVFTEENHGIETGQMYVFLIANNRISRYISVDDLTADLGGDFQEFLEAESFPDVPPGMMRVVSFNSRVTKAGKQMAHAVFADEDKTLVGAMAFPTAFRMAYSRCVPGSVVDIQFGTTKDGATYIEKVL